MKNEVLYNKTVDILVQAYFNDTLQNGNCWACAVGNIVAGNMGFQYCTSEKLGRLKVWSADKQTAETDGTLTKWVLTRWLNFDIEPEIDLQLQSTGYTRKELNLIEKAFENMAARIKDVSAGFKGDELMFRGLMRVVECLDRIHENTSDETTKTSKQKFIKHGTTEILC